MKNKILLRSDVQLQMCINNDVPVEIWVGGFFEGVTSILKFSENSITIANGYYLRSFCKICLNKSVKRKQLYSNGNMTLSYPGQAMANKIAFLSSEKPHNAKLLLCKQAWDAQLGSLPILYKFTSDIDLLMKSVGFEQVLQL